MIRSFRPANISERQIVTSEKYIVALVSIFGLFPLAACGGNGEPTSVMPVPDQAVTIVPTIQIRRVNDPAVTLVTSGGGDYTGIKGGNTSVELDDPGESRKARGMPEAYAYHYPRGDVEFTYVFAHWDWETGAVSRFEHLVYGAWKATTPEDRTSHSFGGFPADHADHRTRPADLPISGTATYHSRYAGFAEDYIGLEIGEFHGPATTTADFSNALMTVEMEWQGKPLATLSGPIQGTPFAGTNLQLVKEFQQC